VNTGAVLRVGGCRVDLRDDVRGKGADATLEAEFFAAVEYLLHLCVAEHLERD
jgi:hypothetical protein